MTRPESPPQSGRLVLRLTTRRDAEAMLPTVIQLGKALDMALSAQFVEEQETVAACTLPLQNVTDFAGDPLPATLPALQSMLRLEAQRCEQLVRQRAERAELVWSFSSDISAASSPAHAAENKRDIAVIRHDWLTGGWGRTLERVQNALASSSGALVLRDAPEDGRNTVVVLGAQDQTLRLADRVARALSADLGFVSDSVLMIEAALLPSRARLIIVERRLFAGAEQVISRLASRSQASLLVLGEQA